MPQHRTGANEISSRKDNINGIDPDFDFSFIAEVKAETEQLIKQGNEAQNNVGLFEIETANEAIKNALTMPDPIYLFDVLIQEKELIILFADTGIGKTVYAMQAAIHIASNGYKVLFLDLELSKKQFQKRYTNDNGEPYPMPETLYRCGYSRLRKVPHDISYTDFFFQSLKLLIERTKAEVIFIDNLTKLAAGDTDSAKATIPILEGLNLYREQGLTIIAIEHNKKVDSSRPIQLNDLQGSKMKANLVDSIFTIGRSSKDKNLRYVKQIKVRDGESRYDTDNVMSMEISKEQGFLGFTVTGFVSEYEHLKQFNEGEKESIIKQVKDLSSKNKSQREISKELNISLGAVNKYLHK
ncbi:MAG: AAA family ATPase [Parafilimonas sp.]